MSRWFIVLAAWLAVGCGSSTDPDGIVDSITLDPPQATLTFAGQIITVLATIRDTNGNTVGRVPAWSSSNPSVGTVDAGGTVSAVAEGVTTITASLDGVSATMTITVDRQAQRVTVAPSSLRIGVGATGTLTATAFDGADAPIEGAEIAWESSNPGVATVSSTGVVTGVAVGSATIRATSDGMTGSAAVTVEGG